MNRQTYIAKNNEVPRNWVHIDATDVVLGRLSAQVAQILLGKNKPEYTPHHDVGDFVVITNADKIKITGRKGDNKFFQSYSGYPGGQKNFSYKWMIENKPELLIERAIKRMMPGNKLAHQQLTKLKVYTGAEHPHTAQNPTTIKVA
jgi:large subunit ribosomal protein L13